jgi:hypothetical protein
MTHRSPSPSLSPGWLLLLGPLAGAGSAAALYLTREEWLARLRPPWTDLFQPPILFGQGAFVTVAGLLFVEWLGARSKGRSVPGLDGWAARTRNGALSTSHPRPKRDQRDSDLKACASDLRLQVELRWLVYAVLALVPAYLGLVVGLNGLGLVVSRAVPYTDFFTPLLAGTTEGFILWLLGLRVRSRLLALIDCWLERCLTTEHHMNLPAPSVVASVPSPTSADSGEAKPRTALIDPLQPTQPAQSQPAPVQPSAGTRPAPRKRPIEYD